MGSSLQSLIIIFKFSEQHLDDQKLLQKIIQLEDRLVTILITQKLGFLESNEFGIDSFVFFLKGPNVDDLYKIVSPLVKKLPPPPGSFMIKRFGDIGSIEVWIHFSTEI